jgi:hypothetical protein
MPHDSPLNPAALDLLAWATVVGLRNGADELTSLCKPAKAFPLPPGQHDRQLTLRLVSALRSERRRSKRLLKLLAE